MRYALVNPQGDVDRFDSSVDPSVQTRAGWRWLPAPPAERPAFDPATQVLEGPVLMVAETAVTESYSVRAKTAGELDANREAALDRLDLALFKIAFNHENRLRALEGKAAITALQFRTAIKALL